MKYLSTIADSARKCISFCLAACCAMLLLGACTDEPYESSTYSTEKEVEVKIFLTVPAPTIAETRTSTIKDDSYYNQDGVYVMIFDGNTNSGKLLQIAKATGSSKIFYAKLNGVRGACYAYIIANSEKIIQANLEVWKNGETTLQDVKSKLEYTLNTTATAGTNTKVLTEMIYPQPMYTEVYLEDGISATTKIGTTTDGVKLGRSTAKISVYNETATTEGTITTEIIYGANLANAPIKGHLFPDHADLSTIARTNSGDKGIFNDPIATPVAGSNNCYLYTFESVAKEKQSTSIIVKASYLGTGSYYYHIRLSNDADTYPLVRNYNYIVHIKSILKKGYSTAEEALANPAGNIEYTLSVTDAYSRDIVSNGEYYLGVENSEFYAFTDPSKASKEALNDQLISIIMHNAKSTVATGRFSTTSPGLRIANQQFSENTGGEQKVELRVSTDPDFTEGEIKVELGDLSRTIKIYKKNMPDKFGIILNDFKGQGYISGTVANKDAEWLKLTTKTKPNGDAPVPDDLDDNDLFTSVEAPNEVIYLRVKANIGDDNSPKHREGIVDFFRKDEGGNTRVLIKQPVHDAYTDIIGQAKLAPYTYVGTFHRHDQVGERIIRVDTKIVGGSVAKWRAFVIYGDFIRLTTTPSADGGIGVQNFYGNGDSTTNFGYDVEKYKVTDGKTDIRAMQSYIYFRVGLTSTIGANAMRYGLIGLQANDNVGTEKIDRYIFVRQGEAADYLMRPEDPAQKEPIKDDLWGEYDKDRDGYADNSVELAKRERAVKFLPFNLTDPNYKYDKDNTPDLSDLRDQKKTPYGKPTDYPSQAGYIYQSLTRLGWIADPSKSPDTSLFKRGNQKPVWSEDYEICPKGYHRPDGGVEGPPNIYGQFSTNSNVEASSVRQSLWLYPKNGGVSSTQNFIIGYMADGFYDRQPMWLAYCGYDQLNKDQPTAVNHGANIAYIGVLTFNPRNLASIFMPMTGYYMANFMGSGARYAAAGYNAAIYTRTRVGNESVGGYYTVDYGIMTGADESNRNDYNVLKFRADNYRLHTPDYAQNIRCVKD